MPCIRQIPPATLPIVTGSLPRLSLLVMLAATSWLLPSPALGRPRPAPAPARAQATPPSPPDQKSRLYGDEAHPATTTGWVETKLYFGLGPAASQHKGVSEETWRQFLDKEVTPRFPAGLSVLDVYGQWTGKGQSSPERIRSKLLLICYPQNAENDGRIEAIRAAWKKKTGDQSVMKVTLPADISF